MNQPDQIHTPIRTVRLDSLTYQSRRYFILPWHVQPDGTVRLVDRGFLGRQFRVFFGLALLVFAAFCFALYVMDFFYGVPGGPAGELIAGGIVCVIAGALTFRWARTRTIDVDVNAVVHIRDHASTRPPHSALPQARLEVRPVHAWACRLEWRPFGLFITDGLSSAALCFALTPEGCLNALDDMPELVRKLPLNESDRLVIAMIFWT